MAQEAVGSSPIAHPELPGRHGAWRSPVAHLLWEQGVTGSNPVAPTSNLSTRARFLVGIFVIWPLLHFLPLERKLPQITADNPQSRIRKVVYAIRIGATPLNAWKYAKIDSSATRSERQLLATRSMLRDALVLLPDPGSGISEQHSILWLWENQSRGPWWCSRFVISRSAVRIRQVAQIIFRRENNSAGIIRRGPHFPIFPKDPQTHVPYTGYGVVRGICP